jgi:kynurenine 3-monooxygenase
MGDPHEHALIVGAGLAGSLMACYLARAGYRVTLAERRPDPRILGFAGGRSINLALSTRGITALQGVGLAERVLKDAIPMYGRMIHDRGGGTHFQHYSRVAGEHINSISRSGLNLALLEAADEHESVTLRFGLRCVDVDFDQPAAEFIDESAGARETIRADFIIAADGAFSAVRDAMLHRVMNFDYAQEFLHHGYKELEIPAANAQAQKRTSAQAEPNRQITKSPNHQIDFALEPNALHIWPRGGSMMIALPNPDGSFTCTLFWPYEGPHSFAAIKSRADILPFFRKHYPDAVPFMPTLEDDYERNPVGALPTIRCGPWHVDGKALLIGDAAHAIVPFFGQGMNAAFEDCRILAEILSEESMRRNRGSAFDRFFHEHKRNADAIADMALENFIEMRDKTASPAFRARKKIENALHRWFPRVFTPLYNMVSFTNIAYADAERRGRAQYRLLLAILIAVPCAVIAAAALLIATLG